jgi:hypothetical protein
MKDKVKKERHVVSVGEKNGRAKLKKEDIKNIRKLLAVGEKQYHIASIYGVTPATISYINVGKTWSSVS